MEVIHMFIEKSNGFCCPEIVHPDAPDDFCIPKECCPDEMRQVKYPSPNSCLPHEVLEELEEKIIAANKFLLSLAIKENEEETRKEALREAFEGLIGQNVSVVFAGEVEEELEENIELGLGTEEENVIKDVQAVMGRVFLAGRDFVSLNKGNKLLLVPYTNICRIDLANRFAEPLKEARLNEIDPCLRRCLTFQFGKVVSSSPELIHIFFGLTLSIFLLQLIDKEAKVILEDDQLEGTIWTVDREQFILSVNDDLQTISLEDPLYIIINDHKLD
jgi:hypothetical protein